MHNIGFFKYGLNVGIIVYLSNCSWIIQELYYYCPVNFNEIPRFAGNDKAFVVFAVGRGWVGGKAANPASTNSFCILNSLSF